MLSFKQWLRTQPPSKLPRGPQGDFVKAARADRYLPDIEAWNQLRGYLRSRGACREAVFAAAGAWRQYRRVVRAHG